MTKALKLKKPRKKNKTKKKRSINFDLNKFIMPKERMPSPEEMAEITKQRAISDAELVKPSFGKGAEYKFDEKGNARLEATKVQVNEAHEEMEKEQARTEWAKEHKDVDEDVDCLPIKERCLANLYIDLKELEEWSYENKNLNQEDLQDRITFIRVSLDHLRREIDTMVAMGAINVDPNKEKIIKELADKKWEQETFEKIEKGEIGYYDFANPETKEKFERVQILKSYEDEKD